MARPIRRYKANRRGLVAILKSGEVRADLESRAHAVAQVARGRTDAEIIADSYTGQNRAGATVIGVPMSEERANRTLGSSISAAAR